MARTLQNFADLYQDHTRHQLLQVLADQEAANEQARNHLSTLHGNMFKIACDLFAMHKNGEQLTKQGLAEYERRIYGEGRQVPPHRTGQASGISPLPGGTV